MTVSAPELARLAALSASAISDALGKAGVFGEELQRLAGSGTFAGRARTIDCRGGLRSIRPGVEAATAGDVIVVAAEVEGIRTAHVGELVATELVRRGVIAVVIDGYVRDLELLRSVGLHVYARGVTPLALRTATLGEVGVPLDIGGAVRPDDVVVGDDDGLVVVTPGLVPEVAEQADAIIAREQQIAARLVAGEDLFDILSGD